MKWRVKAGRSHHGGGIARRHMLIALAAAPGLLAVTALSAAEEVLGLHLVLAFDASASVNDEEFSLQRRGTATALRDPSVKAAIESTSGGIAISIIQWSSVSRQAVGLDWRVLNGAASAEAFADLVEHMPRRLSGGGTMIHSGLDFAGRMFTSAPGIARRRVIDISGNGRADDLEATHYTRDQLVEAGITINGLAIEELKDDLTRYFRDNVIGGPHAFVVTADEFSDFGAAMRRKLLREVLGPTLALNSG